MRWEWLGRVDYTTCLDHQRRRRRAVIDEQEDEVVWMVEHPRTITVGRRPAPGTPSPESLAEQGIAFAKVERGGLATWHGPGQVVAYPIISLNRRGFTVRGYVDRLEQVVIDWLGSEGVDAHRRVGAPGVWVGPNKIAALGVHIARGVSLHGLSVNVAPLLDDYALFIPCGLSGTGVTSMAELGVDPGPIKKVASDLGKRLADGLRAH